MVPKFANDSGSDYGPKGKSEGGGSVPLPPTLPPNPRGSIESRPPHVHEASPVNPTKGSRGLVQLPSNLDLQILWDEKGEGVVLPRYPHLTLDHVYHDPVLYICIAPSQYMLCVLRVTSYPCHVMSCDLSHLTSYLPTDPSHLTLIPTSNLFTLLGTPGTPRLAPRPLRPPSPSSTRRNISSRWTRRRQLGEPRLAATASWRRRRRVRG